MSVKNGGITVLAAIIYTLVVGNTALTFVLGLLAGATICGWWWGSEPKMELSQAHLAYLEAKNKITKSRINDAKVVVESYPFGRITIRAQGGQSILSQNLLRSLLTCQK